MSNIAHMDAAAFDALSPEELLHIKEHGELPAQETPPAEIPAQQVAETPQVETPVDQPSAQEARKGNPEVPLRQLREEKRQLEASNQQTQQALQQHQQAIQQYQAALASPDFLRQALAQHDGQQAPGLAIEDPEAIRHIVNQAIAPYAQALNQMQQQTAFAQQQAQAAQRQSMYQQGRAKYGPEFDESQGAFDTQFPQLAHVDPVEKHIVMTGIKWSDPAYREEQIKQAASPLAAKSLENALASPGRKAPVTLGSVPAAVGNEPVPDINSMTEEEFGKLNDSQIAKMKANLGK